MFLFHLKFGDGDGPKKAVILLLKVALWSGYKIW